MDAFAQAISGTGLSRTIAQITWIIPWLQTFHIAALALVFGSVFMMSARILGLTGTSQTMTQTVRRYVPWVWIGTAFLAVTGGLLVIGEPVRSLVNVFFWTKMGLLVVVLGLTAAFQTSLRRDPAFWEDLDWRGPVRFVTLVGLAAWIGIIVMGRFIAYVDNFIY
jgi:hypothetical protein